LKVGGKKDDDRIYYNNSNDVRVSTRDRAYLTLPDRTKRTYLDHFTIISSNAEISKSRNPFTPISLTRLLH